MHTIPITLALEEGVARAYQHIPQHESEKTATIFQLMSHSVNFEHSDSDREF